jgi:hypothetical protein
VREEILNGEEHWNGVLATIERVVTVEIEEEY